MTDIKAIRDKLKAMLPPERFRHSLRVEEKATSLAKLYRVSENKAALAALLHDCSRFMSRGQMLSNAIRWGMRPGPIEKLEPKLLHAALSARIARKEFGIGDREVLKAIERHTVGAEKMSRLDKIIYLADHIELDRDYKGVDRVRKLASRDLDAAIVASTDSMIEHLLAEGLPVFPETVKTRNAHLMASRTARKK